MFFLVTFLVGFLLTSLFGPKPKIENAKAASLSDFNFPRADEGDPVPRWYGTNKFKGGNTIWVGDFQTVPITKKVKTGLFSSKRQTIGYKYYVGLDLAVALGPNFTFKRIWAGKYELWNGCLFDSGCENVIHIDRPELFGGQDKNGGWVGDIALYCGSFDQSQDSYLISKIDNNVPAYNGVAHMVLRKCYLGNSASIEPLYVEGSLFSNSLGLGKFAIMPNGLDANPIEVIYDLCVNEFANMNIDASKINTAQWIEAGMVLYAENNGMSIVVSNSNTGADIVKQIFKQINGTIFENPSTGMFDLVLIRKNYVVADLPVIGPDQINSITNFTKKLWNETNNRVRVKFTDRSQDYKTDTIAQADDFANIRFQRRINATEFSFPTIFNADLANEIAARELANLNVPLYQCELSMDRSEVGLLPGSVFVLNWPEYGIVSMVMRVRKFGLGTLANGKLTFGVVQDEFASDAVVVAPPGSSAGDPIDYSPQPVVATVFELPYWLKGVSGFDLTAGIGRLAFLAKSPGPYSLGYNALDNSGTEVVELLNREPYTATAKLALPVARFAGFNDQGTVASITIKSVSDASLMTTVPNDTAPGSDIRKGHGLFYLNGELMSFAGAEDNGDGTWDLSNVRRGLIDTGWIGGAIDDVLYFLKDQVGFLEEDGGFDGKLQDVTGQGSYPLDMAATITVAPSGRADRPYPPDGVTIEGVRELGVEHDAGETVNVAWLERNRLTNPLDIKLEGDASEAPEAGTVYRLTVEDELGDTVYTSGDIAATDFDLFLTEEMAGNSLVLVWAKVGAVLSYAGAPFPVKIIGNALTVDGEVLRVDGEKVTVA